MILDRKMTVTLYHLGIAFGCKMSAYLLVIQKVTFSSEIFDVNAFDEKSVRWINHSLF